VHKLLSAGFLALTFAICGEARAQPVAELLKAAEGGDAHAVYSLGEKYGSGDGLEKNLSKSFCWMHRSAEHGYPYAWLSIGMSYGMGTGVKKDNIESYKWFHLINMALEPSFDPELKGWGKEDAAGIAKQMAPTQVEEAKHRAQDWWDTVKARGRRAPNQHYVPFPGDKPAC
jgi:TPR repeat protein